MSDSPETFDHIVIGAGSAGCALAARLTESPRVRVLLIEAGEDDPWVWIRIPAGVAKIMLGKRAIWRFTTEPSEGLAGRALFCPRGKVVGGTSNVNGMFWVRGDPLEYDRWAAMGNRDWGWADLLPVFRRMESYAAGDPTVRGQDGPLVISNVSPLDRLSSAFITACGEAGIGINPDTNSGHYAGAGTIQMSTRRGLRWSTREGYLRPALRRPNLRLVTGAQVTRLLFEGGRVAGAEYRTAAGVATARSAGDLILCAGTIQSPQILELSGIGQRDRLERLGIPVRHVLPGVGENLIDHLHGRLMVQAQGVASMNTMLKSPWAKLSMALRLALLGDGPMTTPAATAHAYVRTRQGLTQPDIKLQLHHLSSPDERNPDKLVLDDFPGFSIGFVHQQPGSRGTVHLGTTDPMAAPVITPTYLSHPDDLPAFVRGLRTARQVIAQPSLAGHVVRETRPGPAADSDDELADYLRTTLFSSYHPVGTCRMGSDALAVVDDRLRVRGMPGLRVADASVAPTMPASNTNAFAILAGERCADFIRAGD
jgi:choline dehydrogenase